MHNNLKCLMRIEDNEITIKTLNRLIGKLYKRVVGLENKLDLLKKRK